MAVIDIAIEMGASFTSIYVAGQGVVLCEPTAVAFLGGADRRNLRAVGTKAEEMTGRTPDKTVVVYPIDQGIVTDRDSAAIMLSEFLKKIIPKGVMFAPKFRALLCVPCGISVKDRLLYQEVCLDAGIKEVTMVESIICAAVGIDLPISSSYGGVVVNIGGGITDIAAISLAGIVAGCSINVGGNMMDEAIIEYIAGKYTLQVGLMTARKIKHEIGSLYPNDNASMEVSGVDLRTKNPSGAVVRAQDVLHSTVNYYIAAADACESIVNDCPPEIAAEVYRKGIFLTGGGSKMPGLEGLFKSKLKLPVKVPDDAQHCVIIGAGKLLGNKKLLNEVLEQG